MLFYNKNKNVGSVTCSHTPTFIVEPFLFSMVFSALYHFLRYLQFTV